MTGTASPMTPACFTLSDGDRITTVPAWSPQSEHAKADSGISFSESLEKPNVRLFGETTLKCHRATNGKNNSENKRVRRHSG